MFTIYISEDLEISRSSYSISQVFRSIAGFLSTLFAGFTHHKFGYRKSAIFFLLLCGGSLILLGFSQSLFQVCLSYGLFGFSLGILGTTGAVRIVKNWFHKHQGTVLGFVTMATGFGGSLMSILLTGVATSTNWRYAQFTSCILLVIVALLYLLVRDRPEEMDLKPYGEGQMHNKQSASTEQTEWAGHTFQELLRMPQFYLMALCIFLSCLSVYISYNVTVPHFQDSGYTPTEASGYLSFMLIALSFAKLLGGWLSDRIGPKKVAILTIAAAAVGQWLMTYTSSPVCCYIGCALLSIGLLVTTITAPLLTMPLFGYRAFGTITGVFMAMISLGNMLATPTANLCYDHLGSYVPAFQAVAILDVVIIGLFLLLFHLCEKEKKKFLASEGKPLNNT